MSYEFPCTRCGACCRSVGFLPELDRGDGTCRHYDDDTMLCKVYNDRPPVCRIDEWHRRTSGSVPASSFYLAQARACARLDRANAFLEDTVRRDIGDGELMDVEIAQTFREVFPDKADVMVGGR